MIRRSRPCATTPPGRIRHEKGDTFSEIYLSYLSGPHGVQIPSSEFFGRSRPT